MTEMIKVLDYFKVPHPFKRGEDVVVVDEEDYRAKLKECYGITKKKKGIPIFRFFIKAEAESQEKDVEDVKNFERKFQEKTKELLNKQELGVWISLAASLIIGYIFYLSFNGLHFGLLTSPVKWIYETFFNRPPDKWVVWTCVCFFPFASACRIFLPQKAPRLITALVAGIVAGLIIGLVAGLVAGLVVGLMAGAVVGLLVGGHSGILSQLKRQSEILKVFDFFGKNRKRAIKHRISEYISELKNNLGSRPALIEKIEDILKKVLEVGENNFLSSWNKTFDELLEELTLLSDRGEFPWPEIRKLSRFKQELLSWLLTDNEIGKLIVISPETPLVSGETVSECLSGEIALDLGMLEGFAFEKAENLKNFLKKTENLREEIYRDREKFQNLENSEEKIKVLRKLASNLEILTVICSHYHFGENPNIPQQKRKGALLSFYNGFYQKLGVGLIPPKKRSPKIKISAGEEKPSRMKKFLLWLAANPLRGLMLTMAIVFLVASSFSFYTLNPNQIGCQKEVAFGIVDQNTLERQLLGEKLEFKEYGQGIIRVFGHDIFWYLPEPLNKPRIVDFAKEQKCDVYYVVLTRNVYADPWDALKRFGQGDSGKIAYEGLKFTLNFSPKTKDWVNYDFDGKGKMRLSRDLESLFRNWQSLEIESFYPQDEEETKDVFDAYLTELAQKGELAKYIEGILQGQFMEGFSYGTSLQNIKSVSEFFSTKIDDEIKTIKLSDDISEAQKAEKIKELEAVKANLKMTVDDYEKGFAEEKANLISNPQLLQKMLEGLKSKEDISLLLREFPNFRTMILNYTFSSYATKKFLAAVNGDLGKETQEKMLTSLKDYLASQKVSDVVGIKEISAKKFLMSQYDYQMRIYQPMQLLNE